MPDDLLQATSPMPQFTTDVDGEYVVQLVVNDTLIDSDPAFVSVFADTPNVPPNADAGAGQSAFVGEVVLLDGSASSDPDDGPEALSYLWYFSGLPAGSLALLNTPMAPTTSFTADVAGDYRVTLEVSDGDAVDIAETIVGATEPNVPPNAVAGDDQVVVLGAEVSLDGTGSSDPDAGPLDYLWRFVSVPADSAVSDAAIIDVATANARFTPDVDGTYVLALDVSDGEDSDSDQVAITVPASAGVCDVDNDGDIDRADISLIVAARNQPASGPDDPRDANGDGVITVIDARTCVVQCTLARCAIVTEEPTWHGQ
jgi:hypothetical protein